MDVKNCFILGAGLGSRMGVIGKILPKVLWPIYEKTLLELQIAFARKWGCQNFFINAHHLSDKIEEFVAQKNINIQILREEVLLGAGGAFLNLKQKIGSGIFLYLNCDTFYFFNQSFFNSLAAKIHDYPLVLAGLASPNTGYRQTLAREGLLQDITPAPSHPGYLTYAGMGLANLDLFDKFTHPIEPVGFFTSCADWRKRPIPIVAPEESFEYWDFGTRERYLKGILQLMIKKESNLFQFLVENDALNAKLLKADSYNGKEGILNFCEAPEEDTFHNACLFMKRPLGAFRGEGLYCEGHFDPLPLKWETDL